MRTERNEIVQMDTLEQIKPVHKLDRLALISFALGLVTLIFPLLSILYLVAVNGGPGYLQSLFCGVPFMLVAILSGIVSRLRTSRENKKGDWMATWGIVLGAVIFVISCIMVYILFRPYLLGTAH